MTLKSVAISFPTDSTQKPHETERLSWPLWEVFITILSLSIPFLPEAILKGRERKKKKSVDFAYFIFVV